jgi:hypothetical protein
MPVIDRHDYIFPGEGCRTSSTRVFFVFLVLHEGCRGHEILHHATVPELVLDGSMHGLGRPPRGVSRCGLSTATPSA